MEIRDAKASILKLPDTPLMFFARSRSFSRCVGVASGTSNSVVSNIAILVIVAGYIPINSSIDSFKFLMIIFDLSSPLFSTSS